jgi:putative nucleotidyltransferase with HDIG domain
VIKVGKNVRRKGGNMEKKKPTREEALELLKKYNKNDALIKHALAVEAVMVHFAEKFGEEDLEKWRVIGLTHDLDYEKYPEEHCSKVREILMEEGWPEDYIKAIQSHGWKICSDVEPQERMEKVLYTIDELTGLIVATVLMRPSRSIMDLAAKSVKKKMKQKSFAAGVDRGVIEEGAQLLGMDLSEVIEETIRGMQNAAADLGLKGEL